MKVSEYLEFVTKKIKEADAENLHEEVDRLMGVTIDTLIEARKKFSDYKEVNTASFLAQSKGGE